MKPFFLLFLFIVPALTFGQTSTMNTFYLIPASVSMAETVNNSMGLGIGYERALDKNGKWAVELPVTIGLPGTQQHFDYGVTPLFNSCYSFMPGAKFYTGHKASKVRYSVGTSFLYETGRQQQYYESTPGMTTNSVRYQAFGSLINNAINVYPVKNFSVSLDFAFGMGGQHYSGSRIYLDPFKNTSYEIGGVFQFILKAGYRF